MLHHKLVKEHITYYLFFIISLLSSNIYSQEGLPIYSDYLTDNYYLIHPSMAGASSCSQVRLTARKLWFGEEDTPGLQTLSYNGRIGERSGIGFNAFNDKNGFSSQSGVYATYAHHIMFSRDEIDLNMLSFGLSVGLLQYRLDQREFISVIPDPLVNGGTLSESNFNIDFGFSYHLGDFYSHVTVKNLLKNAGINDDREITSDLKKYLASLGVVISKPNSPWQFEPSVLLQHRPALKQSTVDLNAKAYRQLKNSTVYGGISYRRGLDNSRFISGSTIIQEQLSYISPLFGVNFNSFTVAYTYTKQLNDIVFTSGGFHQITLGFDFSCRKKRYHCNCPAIN